jgi:UDP-galactopyranose mutase
VLAHVDGRLVPMPINLDTVNALYDWQLTSEQLEAYFAKVAVPIADIKTSEDVIVSKVGHALYEKFFKHYTFKQWGLWPSQLDPTVIARIPVRTNRDDRYFTDSYQAMPAEGYTAMFKRMLDHENITVELGTDYRDALERVSAAELVYSGPVDGYFDYAYGKLPYRSLDFRFETHDRERFQQAAVINYPNEHAHTRVTEFKYLTGQKSAKTTLVYEYPTDGGDPYYPVPRPENQALYKKYQQLAQRTPGVHFVGRLATYKYYNMDQCVAQALTLAGKLIGMRRSELLTGVQGQV